MRRRFQFSLKTLLALFGLLCLGLGSWSLYWTYFGPYIEADDVVAGQPIRVRGRFMDLFGFDEAPFVIDVVGKMADGSPIIMQEGGGMAKRAGWWAYDVEVKLGPVHKPGNYDLRLLSLTKAVHAGKKKMQDDPVCGKITVHDSAMEETSHHKLF